MTPERFDLTILPGNGVVVTPEGIAEVLRTVAITIEANGFGIPSAGVASAAISDVTGVRLGEWSVRAITAWARRSSVPASQRFQGKGGPG
jgi:hypothetical protein